ncbi:MAG: acetyltransferase [Thermoleophilia bacterium]|nr:acetyltransferase [Thermoleophilia bacterium]
MSELDVPHSLEVLDIANGMSAERFLWIRGLSDTSLAPKARIDLIDDVQRHPGELLHLASRDGSLAATTFTIRDEQGAGSCYLTVHTRVDPGEPLLGDVVEFASSRARAGSVAQVRCGDSEDRPHIVALRERHGFHAHERWRRFRLATETAPDIARLTPGALPDGLRVATLAARPGLVDAAFRVYREGLEDAAGDFPRPDETAEGWLAEHDSSPILGRDLVLLLLDSDTDDVLAMVELERLAMGSDRAWVEFLTVARAHRGRGLAKLAKRCAAEHARESKIRRLHTMNHADNDVICAINEQLGWTEDPIRVSLALDLD